MAIVYLANSREFTTRLTCLIAILFAGSAMAVDTTLFDQHIVTVDNEITIVEALAIKDGVAKVLATYLNSAQVYSSSLREGECL
jgi:hypothetical protein